MNIEHTTHDRSRMRRWSRRLSMSQPSTSRPRGHLGEGAVDEERPVTMWPRLSTSPPEAPARTATYMMLERRFEEMARNERGKMPTRSIEARRPRRRTTVSQIDTPASRTPPPLRRKPNFSESVKGWFGSPKSVAETPSPEGEMAKFYAIREAIRAGKLEIAVPPSRATGAESRLSSSPRSRLPGAGIASPRASRGRKTSSAPTKLGELIDRGAGFLDGTGKGLAGKFKPPFEHLHYPPLPRLGRRSRRDSDASNMSFCCIGERETEHTEEVETVKLRQQQHWRRRSFEGTDPWVDPPPAACRLCRKPGIRGVRGLCQICESDFMRPTTQRFELPASDEDDFRPTPPLKDLKILAGNGTKELGAQRKFVSHTSPETIQSPHQRGSVKAELRMTDAGSHRHPLIFKPPVRQNSQKATIFDGEGDDDRFRRWQTAEMRQEYERSKSLHKRLSDCWEMSSFGDGKRRDSIQRDNRDGSQRRSEFYGFYDQLFHELGVNLLHD